MPPDVLPPSATPPSDDPLGALTKDLWHGSVGKQLQAARAIGAVPGPAADDLLIEALDHGDEWVAAEAARVLGFRRTVAAVPALLETLGARGWLAWLEETRAAWKGTGDIAHAGVALAQFSTDIEQMQEEAATALESIGTAEAQRAVAAWRQAKEKSRA